MNRAIVILLLLLGVSVKSWADVPSAKDQGKEFYLNYGCALCHGWDGGGDGINSQKFLPPPTNFHNPDGYLPGSDRDSIRRSIQYGIKEDNSIMPAFEDIPPDEMEQIINYLQSLQKK